MAVILLSHNIDCCPVLICVRTWFYDSEGDIDSQSFTTNYFILNYDNIRLIYLFQLIGPGSLEKVLEMQVANYTFEYSLFDTVVSESSDLWLKKYVSEVVRVSVFCIIMKDFVDNWIPTVFFKKKGGGGKLASEFLKSKAGHKLITRYSYLLTFLVKMPIMSSIHWFHSIEF